MSNTGKIFIGGQGEFIVGETFTSADEWWLSQTVIAVMRGGKWLDTIVPDWEFNINIDDLDLSDPKMCIAGQLFMDKVSSVTNGYLGYDCNNGFDYASRLLANNEFDVESDDFLDNEIELQNKACYYGFEDYVNGLADVEEYDGDFYDDEYVIPTEKETIEVSEVDLMFESGYNPWAYSDYNVYKKSNDRYEELAKLWIVLIQTKRKHKGVR
jgi:hypothetical protein